MVVRRGRELWGAGGGTQRLKFVGGGGGMKRLRIVRGW